MNISQAQPANLGFLSNIDYLRSVNQANSNISQNPSAPLTVSEIALDSEAQAALSAVNNDLASNVSDFQSVHQGLSYSRVMELLEL